MSEKTIRNAKKEAMEFVKIADQILNAIKEERFSFTTGTKLSGSLRRKSMDLTRALADMRKPGSWQER